METPHSQPHAEPRIGLSDIEVYIPQPKIELSELVKYRAEQNPSIERKMRRAVESTGQHSVRFPAVWQDNVTLSAQACSGLCRRTNDLTGLRYLSVGTETAIDMSKPIAAYVEGALQRSGTPIPNTISTFQVQHACAGGTIAMVSVGALLAMSRHSGEKGIIICSDIARYDAPSTAEITQGAGAVALLVEKNPKLLELDLATQGLFSSDVDDFFRPLGSTTARVKGGYSVQCYHEALDSAFADHCSRRGEKPADVLNGTDFIVFHVPFKKMAILAAHKLLSLHLGLTGAAADAFLADRGFEQSLEPTARVGNIYSGSAYLTLAFLLSERYQALGNDIVGKRILLGSYGSGNTMTVLSARVAEGAPGVIASWDLESIFRTESTASIEQYQQWIDGPYDPETYSRLVEHADIPKGSYYLTGVRDDGYREYECV